MASYYYKMSSKSLSSTIHELPYFYCILFFRPNILFAHFPLTSLSLSLSGHNRCDKQVYLSPQNTLKNIWFVFPLSTLASGIVFLNLPAYSVVHNMQGFIHINNIHCIISVGLKHLDPSFILQMYVALLNRV